MPFKIKTEPVTQAVIIIGIVAFSSRLLAAIVIYLGAGSAGVVCAIALVIIVYLALRLAPCRLSFPEIFHNGVYGSANPPG